MPLPVSQEGANSEQRNRLRSNNRRQLFDGNVFWIFQDIKYSAIDYGPGKGGKPVLEVILK